MQNRLAEEQSPYLRQHADNPVDWYAWGEEAFAAARRLDRPIFLSIGYATCHWCHVMAHESFENDAVAGLINRTFIPVKVDREERPDVDSIYMTVCQMMNGHGGWPLTLVLTPDLRPFFAGTYLPPESRGGRIGMLDLVPRIEKLWRERRSDVDASAEQITAALATATAVPPGEAPGADEIAAAARSLAARFDAAAGGFGGPPKFPTPHNLTFLLRVWERHGDERALEMVTQTLRAMRRGGIHDQLAGGFHRYSTDGEWRLPHFEKMLYDQALLAIAYVEAYQATGDPEFSDTARRTLDYVVDELTDPRGGFHSAEDADSEGEEGKFYVWTETEIAAALPDEAAVDLAVEAFGVAGEGNFRDEATGRRSGANVLISAVDPVELAERHGVDLESMQGRLETIRTCLLAVRGTRVRPSRDDKVLADWNGLAIAALARGGHVLGEPRYVESACRAARFVLEHLVTPEGRRLHRWRGGDAAIAAMAEDMAFFGLGCLELYGATWEAEWLQEAARAMDDLLERFEAPGGGFFQTATEEEVTLVRVRESADGALPSANSVAADVLLRLARLTGRVEYEAAAHRALEALGGRISASPTAHTAFLQAAQFAVGPTAEVVVVGEPGEEATERFLSPLRGWFLPRAVTVVRSPVEDAAADLANVAPFTRALIPQDGAVTVYLCRDHACDRPRTDVEDFLAALAAV